MLLLLVSLQLLFFSHKCFLGIPTTPSKIQFQYEGDQVHITWDAESTSLQPIDQFIVIVEATPTRSLIRSRRQIPAPSAGNRWEYETEDTSLTLTIEDLSEKSYTVSVCAVNHLGRECSSPQALINKPTASPGKGQTLKASGLISEEVEKRAVSRPLVIAIAVVVPLMLLVLCIASICAVMICKHCSISKSYYPARQGIFEGISHLAKKKCTNHLTQAS